MSILILSGGAFRGGVQVHSGIGLCVRTQYRAIYGVSVGAVNGVLLASEKYQQLLEFWNDIDGIGGFLTPRWWAPVTDWFSHGPSGVYSMRPLRQKLEKHVRLADLKMEFVAGVVSASTGKYYNLSSRNMKTDKELWDAIEASACMAPIMQPPEIVLAGRSDYGLDGGFRNIIPIPQEDSPEWQGVKHFDVICCTPLDRIKSEQLKEINGFVELTERGISIMESEVFDGDIGTLRKRVQPGLSGTVYAPSFDTGSSFDASRKTIQARLAEGKAMLGNPLSF